MIHAQPFVPFLFCCNGEKMRIPHQDHIGVHRERGAIIAEASAYPNNIPSCGRRHAPTVGD